MEINIVKNKKNMIEVRTQSIMSGDLTLCTYECCDEVEFNQKLTQLEEEFKTLTQEELISKYELKAFKNSLNSLYFNGVRYINVTPHPINFGYEDKVIELPCSGHIINAQPQEVTVKVTNGVECVNTQFLKNEEGESILHKIKCVYPNALIVGSIIAAQAYPGEVVALTPCPGYERVAPSEKRMNLNKVTIF